MDIFARTHLDELENQSIFIFRRGVSRLQKRLHAVVDGERFDAPYESPEDAEIVVRTHQQTVDESVAIVLEGLLPRLRVTSAP